MDLLCNQEECVLMKKMQIDNYDEVVNWSYSLARKYMIENLVPQGVTSERKFEQYKQEGHYLPKNFPRLPDEYFSRRGSWKGWRDFLGYPQQGYKKNFLSYEEASKICRQNGIKNCKEYRAWKKRPSNIPSRPDLYYKEWKGWEDFLGENYYAPKKGNHSKLKESDVRIIKHQLNLGVKGSVLAKMFNVSEMQITRIRREENWHHI